MRIHFIARFLTVIGLLGWGATAQATPSTFEEVSGLVRSNLAGATPEQLDQLAVEGLLKELSPRVVLVDKADESVLAGMPSGIVDTRLYRGSIGYVRMGVIDGDSARQLRARHRDLVTSNQLSGLVLDLRMSNGDDYAAALDVADQFLFTEVPLMNWGEGLKSSKNKDDAISLPVAVLVNRDTGGSAEAVAGMLRKTGVALLIGGRTAGTAGIQQAFPLFNEQFLKITVANIQLGDAQMITAKGLKPDVEVAISADREAALLNRAADPTAADPGANQPSTNAIQNRPRMNEAGLVRRWRGEMLSEEDLHGPAAESGPEARDPALLRALDLMDGLAILRSWQR